jgi:hypothetical protein
MEALTVGIVTDDTLLVAPVAPLEDETYIVPVGGSAGWAGQPDGTIAHYFAGSWRYYQPQEGWRLFVSGAPPIEVYYDGLAWADVAVPSGPSPSAVLTTRAFRTTPFATTQNVNTFIDMTGTTENGLGAWTAGNPSALVAPSAGIYTLGCNLGLVTAVTLYNVAVGLYVNGSVIADSRIQVPASGAGYRLNVSATVKLAANAVIKAGVTQSLATPFNTSASENWISMTKLS